MTRMTWRWVGAGSVGLGMAAVAIACGSSGSSTGSSFGPDGGRDSTTRHLDGSDHADGDHSKDGGGLHSDSGPLHASDGARDVRAPDAACAASTAKASLIPAYLVFVMDRSDSMKANDKWPACSAALEAFFADPSTTGISSSLTFMPYVKPDATDTSADPGYSCVATDYVTPEVPMTALPSDAFAPIIMAEPLKLGTPTTAALEGAVTYAKTIQAAHPNDKVLIVLATDGLPAGCTGNKVGNVADAAASARTADDIPTYVIGVGLDTDANAGIGNLNQVAEAGGTGSAFFIPTEVDGGDGGVTTAAFLAAVKQIQGKLTCKYAIPAPPQGQTLNLDEVNVILTVNAVATTLDYSAGCTDPNGWYYLENDAGVPQQIDLCASSCSQAVAGGSSSSMSIAFGCKTQGGIPK